MNPCRHRLASALLAPLLIAACASNSAPEPNARGALNDVQTLRTFSREAIDQANQQRTLSGAARCDVKVVQLTYQSIGVKGEPVTLSAGLFVPERCAGPFPLAAQAHGTQSDKNRLTTQVGPGSAAIAFFAARGYLVVAADYLGLGKSDYPYHPYLHADSEASAIIDSIRAAQAAATKLEIPLNRQVMLFGYSQGGHATMAAQREIERSHRDEINLVASAPMAGPYNLTQTFLGSWFGYTGGEKNGLASELFAYAVISYNKVYGTLYAQPGQLFSERYAGRIEHLFPGSLNIYQISQQRLLPPGGRLDDLRNPAFSAAFLLDENQPLRVALRKNDLLDWTPRAPMMLCGSRRDAIVDFQNTFAAQAAFRARGVDVAVTDIADDIPASAEGPAHHIDYGYLCFAKARMQLFDPIVFGSERPPRAASDQRSKAAN